MPRVWASFLIEPVLTMGSKRQMGVLLHKQNNDDLKIILELMDAGRVKPFIDRIYPLEEAAQAMAYLGDGHAKGKVVVSVEG